MNRVTLGMDRLGTQRYNLLQKWRVSDLFFLVLAFVINIPVARFKPFERQFYVNDLSISHPYASPQTVNNSQLMVYTIAVPVVTITLFTLILADKRHKYYVWYISLLGLLLGITYTNLLTDYLKNWIGRLRPDFLSRCIPKEGTPKNVLVYAKDVCTTTNSERLYDGFRTTPSGHSSESFAGLGYLYMWLCGQLLTEYPTSGSWRKVVALMPLVGATLIALSRTQDYRHHFVDVIIGSVLGFIIAWWSYRRNFPSIYDTKNHCFKPLLDDSEVTLQEKDPYWKSSGISSIIRVPADEESMPLNNNGTN